MVQQRGQLLLGDLVVVADVVHVEDEMNLLVGCPATATNKIIMDRRQSKPILGTIAP